MASEVLMRAKSRSMARGRTLNQTAGRTMTAQKLLAMLAALALVAVSSSTASAADSSDWNQWRGSGRNGVSLNSPPLRSSLPEGGLKPAWISDAKLRIPAGGDGGWSSPVVAAGRVFLFSHVQVHRDGVKLGPEKYPHLKDEERKAMAKDDLETYERNRHDEQKDRHKKQYRHEEQVHCLDAADGALVWTNVRESMKTEYPHSSTPAVVDGRLYVGTADSAVHAINASDGKTLWTTSLPVQKTESATPASVIVAEGVVVAHAGKLCGVDAKTGELRWEGDENKTSGREGSPTVWKTNGHDYVLANVRGQETICVDPGDGTILWKIDSFANRSTPVVAGDKLLTYSGSRKHGVRCWSLSLEKPSLLWSYPGISDSGSSLVVTNGRVFVQGEKRLACVDLTSGKAVWQTTLPMHNPRYTSLIAGDDKIFYTFQGVLCFSAKGSDYEPLYEAMIDKAGRLATIDALKSELKLNESLQDADEEEVRSSVRQKLGGQHPTEAVSPALAGGKLYLRVRSGVLCYDLRQSAQQAQR